MASQTVTISVKSTLKSNTCCLNTLAHVYAYILGTITQTLTNRFHESVQIKKVMFNVMYQVLDVDMIALNVQMNGCDFKYLFAGKTQNTFSYIQHTFVHSHTHIYITFLYNVYVIDINVTGLYKP